MNIKKGDTVQIRTGKDGGKTGKVLRFDSARDKVVIEGLNLYKKHRRPRQQGEKGEIVTIPRALPLSNVNLYCAGCGRGVRLGVRIDGAGKVRICRKCKRTL